MRPLWMKNPPMAHRYSPSRTPFDVYEGDEASVVAEDFVEDIDRQAPEARYVIVWKDPTWAFGTGRTMADNWEGILNMLRSVRADPSNTFPKGLEHVAYVLQVA